MKTCHFAVFVSTMILSGCVADSMLVPDEGGADEELAMSTSALTETSSVDYPGDRYQHYFYATGGRCVFQTTLKTLSDSVLWLYGPNSPSTLIAYNDDHGGTLASRIEALIEPGVYYPTVGGYGSRIGEYDLSMDCYAAVHYQAHVSQLGWLPWGFDGFTAGTTGQNRALQAARIELKNMPNTSIRYTPHVAGIGWMGEFYDGQIGGTVGQSRDMQAIRIWLNNAPAGCGIRYQAHVAGLGWMGIVSDGDVAGTVGQHRRMEALRVWLTGTCN